VRPLKDVRVIAVEQYGAGPYGSMHLADLGAEVVKIEDPRAGGDVGRAVPPFRNGDSSLFFETFNRNKRSIDLDLSSADGRAVFEDLVRVSDAVYSNLRGDVPAKLGITYGDLERVNRRIVCCSLSGFRDDRSAARASRLRLHPAGHGRLDGHHRRAGRAADKVGPVVGGLLRWAGRRRVHACRSPCCASGRDRV